MTASSPAIHPAVDEFRVLLMEPHAESAYELVGALAQSEDVFYVEHRESFTAGLEMLESERVDLILVDLGCLASASVEGGLLRIVSLCPHTPVVLLCNEREQEHAFAGVRAGAHDYLVRGRDDSDAILRTVQAALQRKSNANHFHYMAHHDSLTGLANRSLFEKCLSDACQREDCDPAVLYIDLDGFKPVNDTYGHDAGDEVLRVVARRLRGVVRGFDVVARLGGDEFAVLLESVQSLAMRMDIGKRIIAKIEEPIQLGPQLLRVSCSVGLAAAAEAGCDPTFVMQCADQAMYDAKSAGKGTLRVYSGDLEEDPQDTTETQLGLALPRGEFELHYQPQVNADGTLFGVEALLRWPSGNLQPNQFIVLLERAGRIREVGRWVLRTALAQLKRWNDEGIAVPRMAVNVSPLQLQNEEFAGDVQAVLDELKVPAAMLELEVTEGVVLSNLGPTRENMKRLRERGVRLALDDFGTGYASLATLHQHTVDTLKVDQCFVRDLATNPRSLSIVTSVLDLARRLKIVTIAEGVETEAQASLLRKEGCQVMQGYLFDRPQPGSVPPLSRAALAPR